MRKQSFGTHEIAKICQVTPPSIWRWVKEGRLPYFTTAGGRRKVWAKDLALFLKERNIPIPDTVKQIDSKKILIVDDEAQIRQIVKRVLKTIDPELEIAEAEDGFEAGRKVTQMSPALIILDIGLPGMNGIKICKMIRSDAQLEGTKILAISGQNIPSLKKECSKAGADDFLRKPFTVEEIKDRVHRLLDSQMAETHG